MPDTHARISASSAERWMICPPSVRLSEQFEDTTSDYAEEGTFAHSLAELIITYNLGKIKKAAFTKQLNALKENEYYNQELFDYVEEYTQQVFEFVNEAKAACKDPVVMTEQKLDFSTYVPEGFGTGDVVIVADDFIHIIDLKYGKGIGVSAVDNPQLRLYGLGAIEAYSMLYDFDRVKRTIIQPRLENVSTEESSVEELEAWGREEVIPRAELAENGGGEFAPGGHCRFCKARKTCRARTEANLALARMEFRDPELLGDGEIGEILRQAEQLVSWAGDVSEYALGEALKGKKFDGWKLVEGRSNRKYTDEVKVADTLKQSGYEEKTLYEKKLYGITKMETLVGKKQFTELLSGLIIKPQGKPVLVSESDKRPELNATDSAKDDFKEETE